MSITLSAFAEPAADAFLEEDTFFILPSPSEILTESESLGLKIDIPAEEFRKVLMADLEALAKPATQESKNKTSFAIGRIFAVSGFKFKDLNKIVLLELAKKIHGGINGLKLPVLLQDEVNRQYQKMIISPKWNRSELMLAFTQARASLLSLLKDSKKIPEKDRQDILTMGMCVELGIWYESLFLTAGHPDILKKLNEYQEIYLMEDVLTYFDKSLIKATKHRPKDQWIQDLKAINDECLRIHQKGKLEAKDLIHLKELLNKVL